MCLLCGNPKQCNSTGGDFLLVELYDGESLANVSAFACVGSLILLMVFSAGEGKQSAKSEVKTNS